MSSVSIGEKVGRLLNRRIAYFVALLMFLNTLDRVNVSFAAKTMNLELGFDPQTYGFGVGLFFATYMLFQVPGVALANRKGPAWTLATLTTLWGVVTAGTGLVWNAHSFFASRLLLGVIEGGVAPVIVLYTSRWIPTAAFGRFSSRSALSMPASVILGAPLSGWLIVSLDGVGGFGGWRWMFLIEGLLTITVGVVAFKLLPERPADAGWLDAAQRDWLVNELTHKEQTASLPSSEDAPLRGLARCRVDPHVVAWSVVFFALCMGLYGFMYWLPQVIQSVAPAVGTAALMALSAVPWCFAAISMLVNGWWSDRTMRRSRHVAGAALLSGAGLLLAGIASDPKIAFLGLILSGIGIGGAQSLFFSIPAAALRNRPNAGFAFACITLAGGLSGLVGANLIGQLRQATGNFSSSIFMLAGMYVLGAAILLVSGRRETGNRKTEPATNNALPTKARSAGH